jgi:dipeptidyl-peptidase-4
MTKKTVVMYLLTTCMGFGAWAQQKKLTIEDAVMRSRTTLAPDRLSQLAAIAETNIIWWVAKSGGKERVVQHDIDANKTDTVLSVEKLDEMVQSTGTGVPAFQRFPFMKFKTKDIVEFQYSGVFYRYNVPKNRIEVINRLPKDAEVPELSPDGKYLSFVMSNNIVVFGQNDYDKFQTLMSGQEGNASDKEKVFASLFVTTDGHAGLQYGKSVHRNEFGITKGMFWSPKGNLMAFYMENQLMVTDYPLIKLDRMPAYTQGIKYPMAGGVSHHVGLYIYNPEKKYSVPVQIKGDKEQYITNVSFSPEEEHLYVAILNRDQNEMTLNRFDAKTGAFAKSLFTERHEKYVEPENPVIFVPGLKGHFLWMSERDGYNHIYLYNHNGILVNQVTRGSFDVKEVVGFDAKGEKIYYLCTANNGLDRHLYVSEIKTGKTTSLLFTPGVHSVFLSGKGNYFIDTYSNINVARKTAISDLSGKEIRSLQIADNPLIEYQKNEVRLFSIKAADGKTDLNCRMILPFKADTVKKKYPVLVYVYGGPHAQMVTNQFLGGADLWQYYMAQEGYIVFTVDNRGSANRGLDFEQTTYRQLGKVETEDQLEGVKYLQSLKYVDADKMGVFGWSYGGFMTLNLMTRADVFKAGVAGGPVVDWRLYEIMYTERYMDKPADNPKGFEDADMTNYIKNLKGKLMLIHGTDDDVVVWQHSLKYIKKAVDDGVQVDYFVYPGHKHNVVGKDRVHLLQKVTDYMNLHVK